ncbi:MAG: hypothetical protein WBE78_00750 [Candidatus Binataceae bacterium]
MNNLRKDGGGEIAAVLPEWGSLGELAGFVKLSQSSRINGFDNTVIKTRLANVKLDIPLILQGDCAIAPQAQLVSGALPDTVSVVRAELVQH